MEQIHTRFKLVQNYDLAPSLGNIDTFPHCASLRRAINYEFNAF